MPRKVVIIGSGPTGLGAAWRLEELNHRSYKLFEKQPYPGGLATSFRDGKGFTWDVGGHVLFSKYEYFDRLMDNILKDGWFFHQRDSWVWMKNRFIPYPFQHNIDYLPEEDRQKCLAGLREAAQPKTIPQNYREWIAATFGQGIAELFLFPYNYKVWAYLPEKMSFSWTGERVAPPRADGATGDIRGDAAGTFWGANDTFRYPIRGGTGEIWKRLLSRLDGRKVFLNSPVAGIDTTKKEIRVNGIAEPYDVLISTLPLDAFFTLSDVRDLGAGAELMHSSVHVFGIGLRGTLPPALEKKCWIYFPEQDCPFYRATVFSNYSPFNVPDGKNFWSLLLEVSESPDKPVNRRTIREAVVQGALDTNLIASRREIVDCWQHVAPYGYPTPSLGRDQGLGVLRTLEERGVYSRGRFGAWKYEVGNMDHSFMQGVEAVNRILLGEEEKTLTLG